MKENFDEKLKEFGKELESLRTLYPGFVLGVSKGYGQGGNRIWTCAGGFADLSEDRKVNAGDIFHCASVSKLLTSTAIMQLVEKGKLNLFDRLTNLLPGWQFPDERIGEVRLWNMLSHTSGIGDVKDYFWNRPRFDEDALRDYVYSDEVCLQSMLWDPQTAPEYMGAGENLFRYSNVAFEILGHIVSVKASELLGRNISYEDYIQEFILQPAEMTSSTMKTFGRPQWNEGKVTAPMAVPHEKGEDGFVKTVDFYPYNRSHGPSSTLTSCAEDLLAFAKAVKSHKLLDAKTQTIMWDTYATVPNNGEKIGLGWFMREQTVDGRTFRLYGHEGTDDGFRASLWMCPETETATVVLSNMSGAPVKKVNKKLFALTV